MAVLASVFVVPGCDCLFVWVPVTFPPSQLQRYYASLRFCIVITIDLYGFLGPATADQLAEQACLCQFAESRFQC